MQTGFIGLGAMGAHMARNLKRAGFLAGVTNRTAQKAQALALEIDTIAYANPAELAAKVDAIILCVSADADVLSVIDAIMPAARPGLLVIDCSTVSADTARRAEAQLRPLGAAFLDCPVSGGVEGARDAALAIMCGGSAEAFARAKPILDAIGRAVTHMGPTGFGQSTKATNQIMCAEQLPLDKVIETLGKGAGSSWYFVNRAPFMAKDHFPAGFRVRLHDKDLKICRQMAARHGVTLSVIETTLAHYAQLIEGGFGDDDISTIFRLKTALFDPKS